METMNSETENRVTQVIIVTDPPKLYASKYKSVEELKKAYKKSATVFNENKALQKKLKSFAIPENYQLP